MIYFIRTDNPDVDRIKIGFTTQDLRSRLSQINAGSPVKLRVVATIDGDRNKETELHNMFKSLHIKGEWFTAAPELIEFINHQGTGRLECLPKRALRKAIKKKEKQAPNLMEILGMSRTEAVQHAMAIVKEAQDEGIPFEIGYHDNKIYMLLEGFVMTDDGTITEPGKVPA